MHSHLERGHFSDSAAAPMPRWTRHGPFPASNRRLRPVHLVRQTLGLLGHPHRSSAHQSPRHGRHWPHHGTVPSGRTHLRHRNGGFAGQNLGSERAKQRGEFPRPHRSHHGHFLLRERLLPGHGRRRRLHQAVGFAQAEELQNHHPGRGLRGEGFVLRSERNLPRDRGNRYQSLPVQAVAGAEGVQRPHGAGHRRPVRQARPVSRLDEHGPYAEVVRN
uniref:(northern house mosquito) hypothetical protein n=1 Tax=Culex pipiens TaxID=7175 RepID=A0A8D8MDS6_CULPI